MSNRAKVRSIRRSRHAASTDLVRAGALGVVPLAAVPGDAATPGPGDTATPGPGDTKPPVPGDAATPGPGDAATPGPGDAEPEVVLEPGALLEAIRREIDPDHAPAEVRLAPVLIDEFKSLLFETVYLEAFSDVAAALGTHGLASGYAHWVDCGRREIVEQIRGLSTVPGAERVRDYPEVAGLRAEIRGLVAYIDDWGRLIHAFSAGVAFKPAALFRPQADLAPLPLAAFSAVSSVQSVTTPGLAQYYTVAPQIVAFYLPQYHRVRENDEWWGEGFTEWTNVRRAKPNFEGHRQPHVPRAHDYYDLADPQVQRRQTRLAAEYGIRAFCYYMYWFDGRRLLERPLDQMLGDKTIEQEFCVCWANENWTRTWDGKADDVLLGQVHTADSDRRFIRDAMKYLADPRYLRIEGRLVLLVYRVDLLRDAPATAEIWREEVRRAGLGELQLCAVQFYGVTDPAPWGFDAAVEFPPHGWLGQENLMVPQPKLLNAEFTGYIFDYDKAVDWALSKPVPGYRWYRGVFPGWDNTARRQDTPHIFANAHPLAFQRWLTAILHQAVIMAPAAHQFVFVNAWNEWGEGAHLEPDEAHGAMNLMALNSALRTAKEQAWVLGVLSRLRAAGDYAGRSADELSLLHHLRGQEQALRALSERLRASGGNPYL